MLCPEVCNFEAPYSTFKFEKIDDGKSLLGNTNVNKFYYNHLVSVTVPDSLRFPDNLTEKLIYDCEYYKVCDLNLTDVVDINFIKFFVRRGKLTLLSINSRIDSDNSIGIIPTGQLILSINKESFQCLGLEGKVSHFTGKSKDRYIIKIDLKEDSLEPGKAKYEKVKSRLQTLGKFTVIVSWEPCKQDVCPSSVAKYFSDRGYKVQINFPTFTSNTIYSVKVPKVPITGNIEEEDIVDFAEWLGMISVGGDLETDDPGNYQTSFVTPVPNEEFGQVKFVQWRGFFTITQIKGLINDLIEYATLANKPWVSVYVQGFSDSPVAWGSDEHHFYTNGDNAYLAIFNENNYLLCNQKCSQKQYK